MDWPATSRSPIPFVMAPGGLGLVQDFLNTIAAGKPRVADLLGDPALAQEWLDAALARWGQETGRPPARIVLSLDDLESLRAFRSDLQRALRGEDSAAPGPGGLEAGPAIHAGPVVLRLYANGRVDAEPRGAGWRRVASLILVEAFDAQRAGLWRRLKTCRNPRCSVAFYDRSRNNSGVWHDVRRCGNAANLRASRARRRAQAR